MKPIPTILSLTALALLGYLLLPRLTVRWQPGAARTTLQLSYVWPEAGPQALEQQVTAPPGSRPGPGPRRTGDPLGKQRRQRLHSARTGGEGR